jgi:hypothetical protein
MSVNSLDEMFLAEGQYLHKRKRRRNSRGVTGSVEPRVGMASAASAARNRENPAGTPDLFEGGGSDGNALADKLRR